MPCGGIYPIKGSWAEAFMKPEMPCWQCNKGGCDLFCMEWDAVLHSTCVPAFLETDDGKIVLNHGHAVVVLKDDNPHVLHEET